MYFWIVAVLFYFEAVKDCREHENVINENHGQKSHPNNRMEKYPTAVWITTTVNKISIQKSSLWPVF